MFQALIFLQVPAGPLCQLAYLTSLLSLHTDITYYLPLTTYSLRFGWNSAFSSAIWSILQQRFKFHCCTLSFNPIFCMMYEESRVNGEWQHHTFLLHLECMSYLNLPLLTMMSAWVSGVKPLLQPWGPTNIFKNFTGKSRVMLCGTYYVSAFGSTGNYHEFTEHPDQLDLTKHEI